MKNTSSWKQFNITVLLAILLSAILAFIFILIIDPYDSLPFSPRWKRAAMCSNQRFSYPMLSKRLEFDSVILGSSTTRLLQPKVLNERLQANFVNLSMDSASFYEQIQLFELFLKYHPSPKYVIFGIDSVWCNASPEPEKFAGRPFPDWLYHKNPWLHAFYMFDSNTFLQAIRQFGFLSGKKPARFDLDGYANFLPNDNEYDLEKAKKHLYAHQKILIETVSDQFVSNIQIKPLAYMEEMIKKLPKTTRVIFIFVPYHHYHQPSAKTCAGAVFKHCKLKFIELIKNHPNAEIIDFMIASEITRKDENYWDPLHYNLKTAKRIMDLIHLGTQAKKAGQIAEMNCYKAKPQQDLNQIFEKLNDNHDH